MGFDLASILSDATQGAGIFQNLAVATTENSKAQNDITDVMVTQANTAKQAAETIADAQGQAKLKTQQTNLQVANVMGTNAADSGWLIGKMGQRVIDADAAASAKLADIKAKQSVDFIDNPIGYLYSQATIGGDIEEYNTAVRQSDLAKDTATKLESMSQSSFLTQNAIEQSVTEGSIAANTILQGYKYSVDANNAALQGLRTNLQGLQQSAQASAQAIDMKFKGFGAQMQQQQLGISYAHLQLAKDQFDMAKEAKKNKMDEDGLTLKLIDQGMFNLSGQRIPDAAKGKELLALYRAGQPQITAMLTSGLDSYMIDPSGRKPVISTSPATASTMFATGMVKNLPQAQQDVGNWLVQQRQEFQKPTEQAKLNLDPKDKGAQDKAFNDFVRKNAANQAATGQGIYTPAAIETVVKTNSQMAQLPVYQKVLAPMVAAGVKLDNPDLVMGAITKAVVKGDISYNDALGISTLYGAGVDMNNAARNWVSTGMPMGTGMIGAINTGRAIGKEPLNLTDKNAIATYINSRLSREAILGNRPPIGNAVGGKIGGPVGNANGSNVFQGVIQ
jgi:hypothetical protein